MRVDHDDWEWLPNNPEPPRRWFGCSLRLLVPLTLVALLPLVTGASGCDDEPTLELPTGTVKSVAPSPTNEYQVVVTISWPDGSETTVRMAPGLCTTEPPRNVYPACADG